MEMKNKSRVYLIISIVSFSVVLIALIAIAVMLHSYRQAREEYARLAEAARAVSSTLPVETVPTAETQDTVPAQQEPSQEETETALAEIPINFDFLAGENEDIIGWIMVDGLEIDFPILYDRSYNYFYLYHNYLKASTRSGSIFVLSDNANDFSDFNTVVYGHNTLDGHMFAPLHNFRDEEFFDSHGEIVVYTPDRKLTYQVFAAYRTDNLNIIRNNDFSTEEARQLYIEKIYSHEDIALFKPEYQVTPSDKIITLSTCIGNPAYRFLVQGVLVSEEMGAYSAAPSTDEGTGES